MVDSNADVYDLFNLDELNNGPAEKVKKGKGVKAPPKKVVGKDPNADKNKKS